MNTTFPEIKETRGYPLPPASELVLQEERKTICARDFKLQNYQRFLRRVLSPDSPVRNLLMVHGTGTGKTCSAIQIAEEYIIRPEFQDKRVLVIANPPVQENFKKQLFGISKISVDTNGIVLSKQCTGRRYLDMIERIQSEPLKWSDPATKDRIEKTAQNIISEFYEFSGYQEFANTLNNEALKGSIDTWIHKTFDNRMIIIDEAHNLKYDSEGKETTKLISLALEKVIKTADNVILIMLTATPMYNNYDEIVFYFNFFLWNDRRQSSKKSLETSNVFTESGNFLEGMETKFRGWCQDYISFIRGDNILTFPFRLPPPLELVAPPAMKDVTGKAIDEPRRFLTLTQSFAEGVQAAAIVPLKRKGFVIPKETICTLPDNKSFQQVFKLKEGVYEYAEGVPAFLSPSEVKNYSSKFSLIINIIKDSTGLIFVFSNLVDLGAKLFAMCLEEHGYTSALGNRLLKGEEGTNGKYILFTAELSNSEINRSIERLKSKTNMNGQDIKIIVASPKVSEGIDLQFIRQVHILDPWWNMSRIEQIVGRGIRTCSHQRLPFANQNCTVYLHICKIKGHDREIVDEEIYRAMVEYKAKTIAKVKKVIMESAMDCPLQQDINILPADWRELLVTQTRSQKNQEVQLKLKDMSSPEFENPDIVCKVKEHIEDPEHERPLSSYLDVRDEVLDKFLKIFLRKPVWTKEDLLKSKELRQYDPEVVMYNLQTAIESGFKFRDKLGRSGFVESRGNMYAFTTGTDKSLQARYIQVDHGRDVPLREALLDETKEDISLDEKRESFKWVADAKEKFSEEVLNWYVVDHLLTPSEKIEHLLNLNWSKPPIYAKPLVAGNLLILGYKKIYNEDNELIEPIGEQLDTVNEWISDRINKYIQTKNNFIVAMKKDTLVFNLDENSEILKKVDRTKTMGSKACGSYLEPTLNKFAEWLGRPFPQVMKKDDRCQYLSLLVRDAVIKNKEGITFWTPEEWSILTVDPQKRDILVKMKS